MSHLLQKLIQISSLSGQEQKIQDFIKTWLGSTGLDVMVIKENLLVNIPGKNRDKALIFNAHVDTVAAGDPKLWNDHPISGKIIDDKIFGLGASDEKAGVAATMLLGKELSTSVPECDVWLTFVTKEELDGSGTKEVVSWFETNHRRDYKNTAAILAEPNRLESIEIGHRGNLFIELVVNGDSGHASQPEKVERKAVLIMSEVLIKLQELSVLWGKKYSDPILGKPSIAVGTSIRAGDRTSPNKFADTCTATLDIRTTPTMHQNTLELLEKFLEDYEIKLQLMHNPGPIGITDPNDMLVKSVQKQVPGIRVVTSPGATDQCFYTQVGIPAIVIGPGEPRMMHQPNEWALLSLVDKAVEVYKDIIEEWAKN